MINKIDFKAKNLTSNAGFFLLLENAKSNFTFKTTQMFRDINFKVFMILTSIVLISSIILAPAPATATVPVSSTIAGQNRSVYVSLHYEDVGEGMAVIKARLQQDVHALEHVFQSLQETGELDGRYPILLVRAGYHPDAESGFAPAAATLSLTPAVALISGFPMEGPLDGIYRAENLGRAYVIDATAGLLSFADLLALVLVLPRLNEQNPMLTVSDAETLAQVKNSREYQAFSKLRLELAPFGAGGTPEGLVPVWQAGVFSYSAYDPSGNRLFELQPLDYYLAKPSWSPPIPRFLAGATEKELYFVEPFSRKTHRIDLTALFPQRYLQISESIELAVSPQGDHIYFTLSFNLPEEFWETGNHTYVFAPDTGEVKVAEAKSPGAAEPAPESSPGAVAEFVDPLPGYVSPVYQLIGMGWQPGRISRYEYESFVSPQWAALLPKDSPLVFFPAGLLAQSRFLAYGSQEEIVVFNIIEQEYYRLNLKELHPADYKRISNIRFAQNSTGDKIYFSLEGYGFRTAAYVWDIFADALEQSGKTLEEMQQEGWAEFAPGAANYLLPPGSKVRVYFTTEDGNTHSFDSHTIAAGSGLSACFGVAWPAAGRQERREHLRQDLVLPVVIEQLQPLGDIGDRRTGRLPGVIYDLSQGGASVHCRDLQAQEGDLLRLTLRLPGKHQAYEVHSQVKWVRPKAGLVGLQFMGMSPELSDELQRMIDIRQRNLAHTVEARLRGTEPEDI